MPHSHHHHHERRGLLDDMDNWFGDTFGGGNKEKNQNTRSQTQQGKQSAIQWTPPAVKPTGVGAMYNHRHGANSTDWQLTRICRQWRCYSV
jgi:MarR-like DNA-binding transcriptional regulator SgrR of sgrS sRNA